MSEKKRLFDHYRKSLVVAGLTTSFGDSLICPLCWQETTYENLSLEHVVPGSVGGTCKVLTCHRCNNEHGSDLDAHLAQFQSVTDALSGHGTLRTKLNVNGKEVIANLEWGDDSKNFKIVGKASNPAACASIEDDFKAGKVSKIDFTLLLGYSMNRFRTAVLRAGYLVMFKCFGYEYARHDIVQVIRRRIMDRSLTHPRLDSLVPELRGFANPFNESHIVAPGNVNGVELFLVVIRLTACARSQFRRRSGSVGYEPAPRVLTSGA